MKIQELLAHFGTTALIHDEAPVVLFFVAFAIGEKDKQCVNIIWKTVLTLGTLESLILP